VAAREEAQAKAAHAQRKQALGQLARGIARDFNNVLQATTGCAATIEKRAGDPEAVRRFARLILAASERGVSVTRRLLTFSRHGALLHDEGPGEGNGLGLAMARGFAEQSGGALSIKSEPGAGTCVFLWLPVDQEAVRDVAPMDNAPEARPGARRLRILLVEDEDLVRQVVAMQLEDEGHEVLQASGAEEALQMLEQDMTTDALVTDLNMPRMNGVELIRAVRARGLSIPAILLTGNAEDGMPLAVESATQQDFVLLRKPVLGSVLASQPASLTVER
jgi:CheY-like chemotaxis protein